MEMKAIEEIGIGEDLTPPLYPLAAVLHDSVLSSYCSACFSTLPPQAFPPLTDAFPENPRHVPTETPTPLYCTLTCSTADSALYFSSDERHLLSLFANCPPSSWDSCDLRLALRLIRIFQNLPQECSSSPQISFLEGKNESLFQENEETEVSDGCMERIAGLMTNREKLVFAEIKKNFSNSGDYDEDFEKFKRIREGAKMMARARGKDVDSEKQEGFALEEMVLCLVMTNAVEVQERSGFCIGIAVYDAAFSWINHSCSANSCYWFLLGTGNDEQLPLRIAPAAEGGRGSGNGDGLMMGGGISERNGYGPRVRVRSVKAVSKGEEVTIAYTDLLQSKEMRQAGLWFKYRFKCSCKRCVAVPTCHADYDLQAHNAEIPECLDDETEKLIQNTAFDDAITDFLSFGDSKSCCQKLEFLLCDSDFNDKLHRRVKLHPFHHLSINTYITLASAYKVQGRDLLALSFEIKGHKLKALNMYKTGSAYSLLLAGVVNHIYMFEPAIVTTAEYLWIHAGEALLILARSSFPDDAFQLELSSLLTLKCDSCDLINSSEANGNRPDQKMQLYNCIADIASKVWGFLSSQSNFLKYVQSPVDFGWLESPAGLKVSDTDSQLQVDEICSDQVRMNLILLSIHCLEYGAHLSSICYGSSVETIYRRALDAIMQTD